MPIPSIGSQGATGVRPNRDAPGAAAAPAPKAAAAPADPVDDEALSRAIETVNRILNPMARGLQFSIDLTTGKTIVKLVDTETQEVLREMPSREMLAIARALDRVKGMLFNVHA